MLATSFRIASTRTSQSALTDAELRAVAPSIFAPAAHESRSSRYTYVPTIDVVAALRKEGFEPFFAAQAKARDTGRADFTKHMLRLRHASVIAKTEVPEIILVNSHDGTSAYQMLAGMFRFVCCNGLVVGQNIDEIRVRHSGDVVGQVIEGAYHVVDEFQRVEAEAESMKAITLTDDEQQRFARTALVAKFGRSETGVYPITTEQVLRPQRIDDVGSDLWRVFNRTQENLLRGGIRARAASGRRTRTRAVNGISENVQLNRTLWTLAEAMAMLKAA